MVLDNHVDAWPHSGIEYAYIVYEMLVEAGETRLLALFKGQDIDVIGPVRSARDYFIDYAQENDAIFVHFGGSPQALARRNSTGIPHIDGIAHESGRDRDETARFWRSRAKRAPHNAYINSDIIARISESSNFRTTSDASAPLNFVTHEVYLEDGEIANTITIPYSAGNVIRYEFDEENRVFIRYAKNRRQVIAGTDNPITVRNIIIVFANHRTIDNQGRLAVDNVGTLNGFFITNGRAIPITAEKPSREAQTIYRDLEGNVIEVNDGNTFIQIVPSNANVQISE